MAGDWIKMRTDLYRDPKVIIMADALTNPSGALAQNVRQIVTRDMAVTRNVMRNAVVGALVTVWGVARHQGHRAGDDLVINGASKIVVDDIADIPGFGQSMASAGWLQETDKGLVFPKFFAENNSDPNSDSVAKNRERQRRYRERNRNALPNVTVTSESNVRVEREKSKENKQKKVSFDPSNCEFPNSLKTLEFQQAWSAWCQHRLEIKKPLTLTSTTQQINKLSEMGIRRAVVAINHTIEKGWQGIREPDTPANPDGRPSKPMTDLAAEGRRRKTEREAKRAAENAGAVA